MSSIASPQTASSRVGRLEVLFEELAELAGQRNAIDGRIVDIVAEIDGDQLWGATGARSIAALVAWKLGASSGQRTHHHRRGEPEGRVPPLHGRSAGRALVAGPGRGDRRPRRRGF